jgi:micrococcal nuclease
MANRSHPFAPVLAPLLAATALLFTTAPSIASRLAAGPDAESAAFAGCAGSHRVTCVVDGDTFWYRGTRIRIADINAPELGHPGCAAELVLAEAATTRLTQLLNAGPFSLVIEGRETDRYGRALRVVMRDGASLGAVLEDEGLAEHWHGRRGSWC